MAERFGTQAHPNGGQRFGSQTYAALSGTSAGSMAAFEDGADTFEAIAQPSVQASMAAVETGDDVLAATGISNLSQTMQAHESATPDGFIAVGTTTQGSLRFGTQDHPLGGLRFGTQSWAALGPNGPLAATESGADTCAAVGWLVPVGYQFAAYQILASFVDYSDESIGAAIDGTLDDGNVVLLPTQSADGSVVFTWELNAFGNPSLRLASVTGATILSDIPWYAWDGDWTAATFDISDAMQGAVFMVEAGADTFIGNGSQIVFGSLSATEDGADFIEAPGGVLVAGAAAAVESGADVFAADGSVGNVGYAELIEDVEQPDSFEAAGGVVVAGDLAAAEAGADSFAATGGPSIGGDLALTETGADSLTGSGGVTLRAWMAAAESADLDTLAGEAAVIVAGALLAVEAGADTAEASGILERIGAAAMVETGDDIMAATGGVEIGGIVAATEAADIFAATGVVLVLGDVIIGEAALADGGADRFVARGIQGNPRPVRNFDGPVDTESATVVYTITSRVQAEAA